MEEHRHITALLKGCSEGKPGGVGRVPLVYGELRRQAAGYLHKERSEHTLQATALIHEAFFKLVGNKKIEWQNRSHFFAIASTAMRRILVDYARERKREKRGGSAENIPLDDALQVSTGGRSIDLIALDEALNRLAKMDKRQARVVELRYFSGLTNEETAAILGVSLATVKLDWNLAKAWLRNEITR